MNTTGAQGLWLAALAIAVLSACSNGVGSVSDPASGQQPPPPTVPPPSDPPPTNPPPTTPASSSAMAGYWKGTATEQASGRAFDAVALIDAEGNAQWQLTRDGVFNNDGFVVFANVCCAAQFDDDATGKNLGETNTRDATVTVEVANNLLSGELQFRREQYRFSLNPSSDYNRALALADLAGVYTRRDDTIFGEEVTLTMTIESSGQLTGSYSNGCVFNGSAAIPDASHNMVRLQIDLANCGSRGSQKAWNGSYAGLGVLLSGDDIFYHSVIGPTWLGPQSVQR
ncbi:MAG TPA: hypothetical protein VL494_15285 [Steroidobacteraceae bacterium]|nr:hypothetical protein [Steroidobacteraceae bacterium]